MPCKVLGMIRSDIPCSDHRNVSQSWTSDNISELLFQTTEVEEATDEKQQHHDYRNQQRQTRRFRFTKEGPAKTIHDTNHRVNAIKSPPFCRNDRTRIGHRRRE